MIEHITAHKTHHNHDGTSFPDLKSMMGRNEHAFAKPLDKMPGGVKRLYDCMQCQSASIKKSTLNWKEVLEQCKSAKKGSAGYNETKICIKRTIGSTSCLGQEACKSVFRREMFGDLIVAVVVGAQGNRGEWMNFL